MKGLVKKDLLLLVKNIKTYIFLLVFYLILGAFCQDFFLLDSLILVFLGMLVVTTMSYDDKPIWDAFVRSMPIKPNRIVLAKYITAICLLLFGCLLIAFVGLLLFRQIFFTYVTYFLPLNISIFIAFLFVSVSIPIIYKFGSEKGRMINIAALLVIVAIICIPFFFSSYLSIHFSTAVIQWSLFFMPLFGFGMLVISYFISVKIFRDKIRKN